jgi:nucleoside-diphosphate-sugar epimerase
MPHQHCGIGLGQPARGALNTIYTVEETQMKVLILGMGNVGKALAAKLRTDGHTVVGTTTTPAKVDDLKQHAQEVFVLKGTDTEAVAKAAEGCDLVVCTVAPNVRTARTPEEREASYRDTLVGTTSSAAKACDRVLFLSSFSVYGDGGEGTAPIDELTPTSNKDEPSSKYYQEAEQQVLGTAGGCVLRLPDIYGAPGDLSFEKRCELAHEIMGGKIPFGPDAPLYGLHFEDAVAASLHVIEKELKGIYNVCDDTELPLTNKEVFDSLCKKLSLEPLVFLNHIKGPVRKISAKKLADSGFRTSHKHPHASRTTPAPQQAAPAAP